MSSPPLLIERRAQQTFSMTTTKAHDDHLGLEFASALREAGLKHSWTDRAYMAPGVDPSHLTSEVVTILGAAGGLGGIAAILKAFFGRHKGMTVKFGENGEVLEATGLSVDDIIRLLDKCSPRTPPDLVVRDACDNGGSEEPIPDKIFEGEDFEPAMIEARQLSREGPPKEVVMYVGDERRVIRRYEDGHEVPRSPDCPPWCELNHYEAHDHPVWHLGTIGTITQPDGARVNVRISRDPAGKHLVNVEMWVLPERRNDHPSAPLPPGPLPEIFGLRNRPPLPLSEEHTVRLAELADLLGHTDLARYLTKAARIIRRADRKSRRVSGG